MEEKKIAIDVKSLTVEQITKEYDQIQAQIEESDGYPSQELQEMKEFITAVMENKVDQICLLRSQLEANIEACSLQIKNDKARLDRMDYMMEKVMRSMKVREINGSTNRIAFRKSSSVDVTDIAKVPSEYKNITVELKQNFPSTDEAQYLFWATVILKRHIDNRAEITEEDQKVLDEHFTIAADKAALKKVLKTTPIEGVSLVDSENVQYQVGKAKMKAEVANG